MSQKIKTCLLLTLLVYAFLISTSYCQKSDIYALIIGISGYEKYPSNNSLQFADEDANAFLEFLQNDAGYKVPTENIKNIRNENAIKDSIIKSIRAFEDKVRPEDIFFVFFSGHIEIENSSGKAYIMPYDAHPNPDSLYKYGIATDYFVDQIYTKIGSNKRFLFVDACWAGSIINGKGGKDNSELKPQSIDNITSKGFIMMLSCANNQKSQEDYYIERGIFTHFLIEGLKGAADKNSNKEVTVAELDVYLKNEVLNRSKSLKTLQNPVIVYNKADSDFILAYPHIIGGTEILAAYQKYKDGLIYLSKADTMSAIVQFQDAIEYDPNYLLARNRLCSTLYDAEKYEQAYRQFLKGRKCAKKTAPDFKFHYGWLKVDSPYNTDIFVNGKLVRKDISATILRLEPGLNKIIFKDVRNVYLDKITVHINKGKNY